jgi:hypothetical protein
MTQENANAASHASARSHRFYRKDDYVPADRPSIVIYHGIWAYGSRFRKVIPPLHDGAPAPRRRFAVGDREPSTAGDLMAALMERTYAAGGSI